MRLFVFGDVVLKGFCNFTDIVHVAWDLRPIHREAVIDGARDNVEMDVKYRLAGAGTVRLKDIDAFGGDHAVDGARHFANRRHHLAQAIRGRFKNIRSVELWYHQGMPWRQRIDIHKRLCRIVFIDREGRNLALDDHAKDAAVLQPITHAEVFSAD